MALRGWEVDELERARRRIRETMQNPASPYFDRHHWRHQKTIAEMEYDLQTVEHLEKKDRE